MQNYNVDNKSKIDVRLPKQKATNNLDNVSSREIKLKDDLMSLIIDTQDEVIELKVNGEMYSKIGIHDEWRQTNINKATYFSYQEKAAKDFIFRFNKCGILSDQVGMGKTIEAGMILSELAYRKELGSVLILVPNEKMAEKWENELAKKFGFRNFYKDVVFLDGKEEKTVKYENLPKVYSVKSLEDLYSLIFNAYERIHIKLKDSLDSKIIQSARNHYDQLIDDKKINEIRLRISELLSNNTQIDSKEFKLIIAKNVFYPIVDTLVKNVVKDLKLEKLYKESLQQIDLHGQFFHIIDMHLDAPLNNSILANGIIERIIDKDLITNSLINEFSFIKAKNGKDIVNQINVQSKAATSEKERAEYTQIFLKISEEIRKQYAFLIISKTINRQDDEIQNSRFNLLNFVLNEKYESESIRYVSVSQIASKGYRVIDLLIHMAYKTLIVDEAHDYIKVSHKKTMSKEIIKNKDYESRQLNAIEFSDLDLSSKNKDILNYNIYPLYNDYYFIEKESLFVEIKALADRSYRKIFMTATPIKSDMVDFYLLYLLTDSSDTLSTIRNRKLLSETDISKISMLLLDIMSDNQKKALNCFTHEDIVYNYVYTLYRSNQSNMEGTFEEKIKSIINDLIQENQINLEVVKSLSFNEVRTHFQKTFTIKDDNNNDKEIRSISELVSSDKGIEQWQNMYSQIGIRATRHQTFQLSDEQLSLIKPIHREKYSNLPIWSRRNGTIVYIYKRDSFFDVLIREILETKKQDRITKRSNEDNELREISILIPKRREIDTAKKQLSINIEKLDEEELTQKEKEFRISDETKNLNKTIEKIENKYKPKEQALEIFNYINSQLTGKLYTADYYSTDVHYDEFRLHMVSKLMTDGLEILGSNNNKKISGKVLIFTDASMQKKVLNWLIKESDPSSATSESELNSYISRYKHQPLWYYNSMRESDEDKWIITTDIKALNDKKGNYLIVVEPDKYEEGVDLQSSNTLINFDIKFDPLKMEQRIGRIDRVKLLKDQPQLDIISFTPLNDLSGFMVDFLANDLEMFSRWKGDTTGIVTFPLGEEPNSATFESAILTINQAYESLYQFEEKKFLDIIKKLQELTNLFLSENNSRFLSILEHEDLVISDFKYLKESKNSINDILFNSDVSNKEKGDEGHIMFGELCVLSKNKALEKEEISHESINNHKNNLKDLKESIKLYYDLNIEYLNRVVTDLEKFSVKAGDGLIEASGSAQKNETYKNLKQKLFEFKDEYAQYKKSELFNLTSGSMGIEKQKADLVLDLIFNRYKETIKNYLNGLIDIFDSFCEGVSQKSLLMSKFISHLTIEEFKVVANSYE